MNLLLANHFVFLRPDDFVPTEALGLRQGCTPISRWLTMVSVIFSINIDFHLVCS